MLYTRRGDDGRSGLFGTKERWPKASLLYEALGTVDELNSLLGVCRSKAQTLSGSIKVAAEIKLVQERLFVIQAELAGADKTLTAERVIELEQVIAEVESLITNPHAFVIPGATEFSALCDYARAVARRAERAVIRAGTLRQVSLQSKAYLNRLSSFLYALARYGAKIEGASEDSPTYQ